MVLGQEPGPDACVPLREIYAPEKHAHDQVHDLIIDRLTIKPIDSALVILRAIGGHPGFIEFDLSFINTDLERRVGHLVMLEMHPVFWPRQAALRPELFIRRRARQWNERAEDRHARWPARYLLQRAVSDTGGVVIKTKDE